jgi:hypothetical protein
MKTLWQRFVNRWNKPAAEYPRKRFLYEVELIGGQKVMTSKAFTFWPGDEWQRMLTIRDQAKDYAFDLTQTGLLTEDGKFYPGRQVASVKFSEIKLITEEISTQCTVPPPGWSCSRQPGHEGPCAAREATI